MELTIEQKRALALAAARARAAGAQGSPQQAPQNASTAPSDASQGFQRAGIQPQAPLAVLQPAWDAMSSGISDRMIKTFLGVRQLFGGLSDEQKGAVKEMKAEQEAEPNKGLRTAGDVAANVLLTAAPAGKAEKVLRGAAAVPSVLRSAGAAAGAAGATDFLTHVGEGDTYADQMADKGKAAATSAAIGGGLAGAMRFVTQPFAPTAEAKNLMDRGINPTLQQGAEGKAGRWIGGLTSGAVDVRNRQEQEVARALLDRVTDGNVQVPHATGREIYDAAKNYVDDGYGQVFQGKRFPLSPKNVAGAQQAAQQLNARGQFVREATDAGRTVGNVFGNTGDRVRVLKYDTLMDDFLEPLSKRAYDEAPNDEIKNRILAARQYLIDNVRNTRLSPEEAARVKDLDVRNFDVNRIREAIKGSIGEEEGLTISRLATAYAGKSMPGNTTNAELIAPTLRVLGRTPRQDQARSALIAAGKVAGLGTGAAITGIASIPAAATVVGGLYGTSLLGQTAQGARALMGQTETQKALADLLRRGVVAPTAATIGSQVEE